MDSLGLNEQELVSLSVAREGPYSSHFPVRGGSVAVYKAVEIIHWLLVHLGRLSDSEQRRPTGAGGFLEEEDAGDGDNELLFFANVPDSDGVEEERAATAVPEEQIAWSVIEGYRLQRVHFQCLSYQLIVSLIQVDALVRRFTSPFIVSGGEAVGKCFGRVPPAVVESEVGARGGGEGGERRVVSSDGRRPPVRL